MRKSLATAVPPLDLVPGGLFKTAPLPDDAGIFSMAALFLHKLLLASERRKGDKRLKDYRQVEVTCRPSSDQSILEGGSWV